MPAPTSGYTLTSKNLGGQGKIAVHEASDLGYRLSLTLTDAAADGESYISLGGFRIGTATFGTHRALYVYSPAFSSPSLDRTIWEGIPIEVVEENNLKSLVCDDAAALPGLPSFSTSTAVIGGGTVSLDTDEKIVCQDKGSPEEEKQAMIGSKRITVGRFGNVWAISIHPSTTGA
jgi:hypothetical protein